MYSDCFLYVSNRIGSQKSTDFNLKEDDLNMPRYDPKLTVWCLICTDMIILLRAFSYADDRDTTTTVNHQNYQDILTDFAFTKRCTTSHSLCYNRLFKAVVPLVMFPDHLLSKSDDFVFFYFVWYNECTYPGYPIRSALNFVRRVSPWQGKSHLVREILPHLSYKLKIPKNLMPKLVFKKQKKMLN